LHTFFLPASVLVSLTFFFLSVSFLFVFFCFFRVNSQTVGCLFRSLASP
jgi:hypothetical protein